MKSSSTLETLETQRMVFQSFCYLSWPHCTHCPPLLKVKIQKATFMVFTGLIFGKNLRYPSEGLTHAQVSYSFQLNSANISIGVCFTSTRRTRKYYIII